MSCPYCGNDRNNTFDWNQFGQFLVKCSKCKTVFRPSKQKLEAKKWELEYEGKRVKQ